MKLVASIIAVTMIAGGIAFYVFTVSVRSQIPGPTGHRDDWTSGEIARDPTGYLNACTYRIEQALADLKSKEIAAAQLRAQWEEAQHDSSTKREAGETALDEIKLLYREAASTNSWPVTWRGRVGDQAATRRQIVELHSEIETEKERSRLLGDATQRVDAFIVRIEQLQYAIASRLSEVDFARENLKLQALNDAGLKSITELQTRIAGVIERHHQLGTVPLAQIQREIVLDTSSAHFDDIMREE